MPILDWLKKKNRRGAGRPRLMKNMPRTGGGNVGNARKPFGLTTTQKNIVNKLMDKRLEHKLVTYNSGAVNLFNPANDFSSFYSTSGDLIPLSPYSGFLGMSQGTSDATRIGNEIRVKRAWVKINLYPNAYNATYNATPQPQIIKIWIFKMRQSSQIADVQSVIFNNFLDTGSSATGLQGTLTDLTRPVNKEFVILHRAFIRKLGCSAYDGTGGTAGQQYFQNNEFRLDQFLTIDVTKYLNKRYHFNDNTSTATDRATWMLVETIPFNNDTANGGIRPASMYYSLNMEYYDA